ARRSATSSRSTGRRASRAGAAPGGGRLPASCTAAHQMLWPCLQYALGGGAWRGVEEGPGACRGVVPGGDGRGGGGGGEGGGGGRAGGVGGAWRGVEEGPAVPLQERTVGVYRSVPWGRAVGWEGA